MTRTATSKAHSEHTIRETFATNLRVELATSRTKQTELAERLGVHKDLVSRWCRGVALPSWESIAELANVFDCDPGELIDGRRK